MTDNTRRDVLAGFAGATVGASLLGAAASTPAYARRSAPPVPASGDDWALLAPARAGFELGCGWRADRLERGQGALTLTLDHPDRGEARVAICYHQGAPRGLAHTELLDLILMDGGDGDRPTEESVGVVLMKLAQVIGENEVGGAIPGAKLASLLTHDERVKRFGPDVL